MANKIVHASFFKRDPITCARGLIGAELIWGDCSGILVEVEAYAAIEDEGRTLLHGRAHVALSSETSQAQPMSISIMGCTGC